MLVVPPRAELRHRPLDTQRLLLVPVEPADAPDLWNAVDASRAHLEKWLPWVPFNTDLDASWRYCEASASDWDHARALRFAIRERAHAPLPRGRRASSRSRTCTRAPSSDTGYAPTARAAAT